jgi:hypothetical protein
MNIKKNYDNLNFKLLFFKLIQYTIYSNIELNKN